MRVRAVNNAAVRPGGDYVLYWMTAARRARYNLALDRAIAMAAQLGVPLIVLEALRLDYPWASERFHAFVLQGMRDNASAFARSPVAYYPYVERRPGQAKGLVATLAKRACVIVTDDFPCFFLPQMLDRVASALPVCVEAVDGNGLYPMRATTRVFTTAASFRRHLQKELPQHLEDVPAAEPLKGLRLKRALIPNSVERRWPSGIPADAELSTMAIDHAVPPSATTGGCHAATRALTQFVDDRLHRYTDRNQPEVAAQSRLSAYLHFGHISAHEIFVEVMRRDGWSPHRLADAPTGSRTGWWGASSETEAFVDQLVTWRELGFNKCAHDPAYASYASLPSWAKQTLAVHASDPRPFTYDMQQFECAQTHDDLWNAAQNQLVNEGTIHNYLRMLWGKKILEWASSPQHALRIMIELNNKYALDGRDPNSYSGIFWVLGRYDRAWGERPIFGKVRYMSSQSTARKLRVRAYVNRYAGGASY